MRHLQISLLLIVAIFATGCPKYAPKVDFNRNGFVKQINDHFTTKQTEYFDALDDKKPEDAKIIRNHLIEDVLPYIDEAYMSFITDLQAGRDRDNFLADLIELGAAATISSLKGTQRSIQLVGVGLTAFKGGRRSADLNFYKEQSTPVLISKMDGNRAKVRATILNREREEVSTYSIKAAIGDIVDYYNAGTLVRAFTELTKDTALQTKASEDNVLVLKGVPLTPAVTKVFRDQTVDAQKALTTLGEQAGGTDLQPTAQKKAEANLRLKLIYKALAGDSVAGKKLADKGVTEQSDGITIANAQAEIRQASDDALLNTIDRAILDNMTKPLLAATPTPSPAASPSL